jgi:hypothetical protein
MWQSGATALIGSINANWRVLKPDAVQVFNTTQYGLAA